MEEERGDVVEEEAVRAEEQPLEPPTTTRVGEKEELEEKRLEATNGDEKEEEEEEQQGKTKKVVLYRDVRADTRCSICWGTVKNCVTVRVCLHRFCNECVQESIRKNQMCCPECRAKVASRRDFVRDPKFDEIVNAIYAAKGGAESYDEKEEKFSRKEATTILEDNLEKQREEKNRYDAIAEQIKKEQQERKEQRFEKARQREQREKERKERMIALERDMRLQQQDQLQRQIIMQQQQRVAAAGGQGGAHANDPHFEHLGMLGKGVNAIVSDDDVDDDESDRFTSQAEYDRRVREAKEKIKRAADAKRMAMMASGMMHFNWESDDKKLKPLPMRMNVTIEKNSDNKNEDTKEQQHAKRKREEEEEEEEEEERHVELKREDERRNFNAVSNEHMMSGRVYHKKVKDDLSFLDLVKMKTFDAQLTHGTSSSKTVSSLGGNEDGEGKDRGSDEENDISLANINNQTMRGHQPAANAPIVPRGVVPKLMTISHENGMMHKSAIVKEDFIHISLRRVLGDPLAIAKFDHMLVPKDLTIENLLSSFVVQNYFVSAIVWKDKEGSEEKKKNEKLRIANFKFGKEADEVMCAECGSGHAPEKILLCDGCDAGFHCFCLTPKLDDVPEGDDSWYCDKCESKKPHKNTTVYELFKDEIEKGAYPLVLNYTGRA